MKLRTLLFFLIVLLPITAAAQFTQVSATVTDPNGLAYANGTVVAKLVLPGGTSPTLNGLAYTPPSQPVGLNSNGFFLMQIADNNVLLPAATQWSFTVCSAAGTIQPAGGKGPVCFNAGPITITGASQSITATLNAAALALSFSSGGTISSGTVNTVAKYTGTTTIGNSNLTETAGVLSWVTGLGGISQITGPTDADLIMSSASGHNFSLRNGGGKIFLGSAGNQGISINDTLLGFQTDNQIAIGTVGGAGAPKSIASYTYLTATNCQLGGATGTTSPAACGSAVSGSIAVPASQTSYVVNTTGVTANSHIFVQQITDNSGISTATCNTGTTAPIQSARVAGTSFTITLTSVASVTCFEYWIVD